jgi:hypothetical protein
MSARKAHAAKRSPSSAQAYCAPRSDWLVRLSGEISRLERPDRALYEIGPSDRGNGE